MIADEISIIEEKVKLELIVWLVESLNLNALEGVLDGPMQAESIRENVKGTMQVCEDALRMTREIIRRSSKNWRPFTHTLKNAAKDSEIMSLVQHLAAQLSEAREYSEAAKLWLDGGAKGNSPQPPKMAIHFGRVSQEARQHADRRLRAAVADYEKTNEQSESKGRTRRTTAQ